MHFGEQKNRVVILDQQIRKLTEENEGLKHRLATAEAGGLSNEQIIHSKIRDMRLAAWLHDGRSAEVAAWLEADLPAFVELYRTSGSFSPEDVWTLHEIRDHYQKYHLPMSAEMAAALPTPYPPCNASTARNNL